MGEEPLRLVKGTLDLMVLKALVDGPRHGYEVTTWLEGLSDGRLDISDSALYQALQRLEKRGLVAAEWGATENNRRARYYSLTDAGEAHLRDEVAHWLRYSETLNRILTTT